MRAAAGLVSTTLLTQAHRLRVLVHLGRMYLPGLRLHAFHVLAGQFLQPLLAALEGAHLLGGAVRPQAHRVNGQVLLVEQPHLAGQPHRLLQGVLEQRALMLPEALEDALGIGMAS